MRPRKVILCVDDDEQNLSVLKFTLETNGFRVITATNGYQAISLFINNTVDLVLADYSMPNMDGSQLILKLKGIASHIPMVLLGDIQKMNGKVHGSDALLDKRTISTFELLERVKIMSARKHGPRPGFKQVQPEPQIAH